MFGHYISIEDDMAALVRYKNGVTMSYHLTAYSPWEGYRVAFKGTKGRLGFKVTEQAYVSGAVGEARGKLAGDAADPTPHEAVKILLRPHWSRPVAVGFEKTSQEDHGGGDARMLRDLFDGGEDDPLGRATDHRAGARSILTGIART